MPALWEQEERKKSSRAELRQLHRFQQSAIVHFVQQAAPVLTSASSQRASKSKRSRDSAFAIAQQITQPKTAYLHFVSATAPAVLAVQPEASDADVQRALFERWDQLTESDVNRFVDVAAADVARYRAEVAAR